MQLVLRRYRMRLGTVEAAARQAERTLVPLLRQVPGFAGFYLVSENGDTLVPMGLFATPEGTAAANRIFADWFRADWPTFRAVPPEATSGDVLVQVAGPLAAWSSEAAEGFPRLERRAGRERRTGEERRAVAVIPAMQLASTT